MCRFAPAVLLDRLQERENFSGLDVGYRPRGGQLRCRRTYPESYPELPGLSQDTMCIYVHRKCEKCLIGGHYLQQRTTMER